MAYSGHSLGSRTAAYPITHGLTPCPCCVFHVKHRDKKFLLLAIFLFVIASAFGRDKIEIKVFETSNDFAEIREAFQKRLYDVSSEFKYFYHLVSPFPFDIDGELFDRKAKIAIRKNKYFIFEIAYPRVVANRIIKRMANMPSAKKQGLGPGIILVNKENLKAVVFNFNNEGFERAILCSQVEIDEALSLSVVWISFTLESQGIKSKE